jgi:competence protein ComEA
VVTLSPGSRVLDAVALAGGLSEQADQQAVNLARRLKDGENVYVPALGEAVVRFESVSGLGSLVDINRATQDQLESLPGIGPATAQAILQYRLEHGSFQAVDDLDDVPGIGPATVENLRNLVTVEP